MTGGSDGKDAVISPDALAYLKARFDDLTPMGRQAVLRHGYESKEGPETLEEIGQKYGVTRERVRQVGVTSNEALKTALKESVPDWWDQFARMLLGRFVVHFGHVADVFGPGALGSAMAPVVLGYFGYKPVPRHQWWYSLFGSELDSTLRDLMPDGPVLRTQWEASVEERGIPLAMLEDLTLPGGKLVPYGDYLVRARSEKRDIVSVTLKDGPLTRAEIGRRSGLSANSVRRTLDHNHDFVVASKGTWALAGTVETPKYRSALPAVMDVLRERGPLTFSELVRAVSKVHDVTSWRIHQVVDDYRIGTMPDGRIWLVEHGATREQEVEPPRPNTMVSNNGKVAIRLTVNRNHARGSGFILNRWVCWALGLRAAPESMTFDQVDQAVGEDLTVTRTGAGAAFGSIKSTLERNGLAQECDFVIVLDVERRTWRMIHTCTAQNCAARV